MKKNKGNDLFIEINGIKGIRRGDMVSAMVPVDLISAVEWNPNEMDEKEFALLKSNIKEHGFLDPVAIIPNDDGRTFKMNGGEHRWKAAKDLGIKEIPCEILHDDKWQDEDLQQLQAVRFNVIHGKMNPQKFLALYNKAVEKFGQERVAALMGYADDTAIKKIIKSVAKEMREVLPPEMVKEFDEKAKQAKTIGDIEKIIQHLFQEHGDSVKYNFMVFAWGGREHVYIAMNKDVHNAMKKIMLSAKKQEIDVNEIIGEAMMRVASSLQENSSDKKPEF